MREEAILDRLTAEQDRANPDWDIDARVSACKDLLLRNVLTWSEARQSFGERVCNAALKQLESDSGRSADAPETSLLAARLALGPQATSPITSYPDFDDRSSVRRQFTAATIIVACMIASGAGGWSVGKKALTLDDLANDTNSLEPQRSDKSQQLIFSMPSAEKAEQKIEQEVAIITAGKAPKVVPPQQAEEEINRRRKDIEDRIIALEAQKRFLKPVPQRTSESSSSSSASRSGTRVPSLISLRPE